MEGYIICLYICGTYFIEACESNIYCLLPKFIPYFEIKKVYTSFVSLSASDYFSIFVLVNCYCISISLILQLYLLELFVYPC